MLRRSCLALTVAAVSALMLSRPASAQDTPVYQTIPSIGVDGPVYFRNAYAFSDERGGEGASASLVELGGKIYALTAKHLLTDAMGIEPAVKPSGFNKALDFWVLVDNPGLYDPDSANIVVPITGIHRPNDNWDEDVMLLATDASLEEASDYVLPIAAQPPAANTTVALIGCPYSAKGACGQNIYYGKVVRQSGGDLLFRLDSPPDRLSGFSGAPIIDRNGEIVAVLSGGAGDLVQAALLPDWLRKGEP